MRRPLTFLTLEQVLSIHERMIEEFGGIPGIRDHGLLQSAVMIPAAKFGGTMLHNDLPSMAAAYLFHLCKNHAFVDGNKRTALAASEMILLMNGNRLSAPDDVIYELTISVADGTASKKDVTASFHHHVTEDSD